MYRICRYCPSLVLITALLASASLCAQEIRFNRDQLEEADKRMDDARRHYLSCASHALLENFVAEYVKAAKTPYEKNTVANVLFNSDATTSYRLHKEAFEADSAELSFVLEYGIELHRRGKYGQAARLYKKCLAPMAKSYKLYTWLADCYINLQEPAIAGRYWDSASHSRNHSGMEEAIHSIYGKADQFRCRDSLRRLLSSGKTQAAFELIHLGFNWEYSWWNLGRIGEDFYKEDEKLIKAALKNDAKALKTIQTYIAIKKLAEEHQTEQEKLEALMKKIKEEENKKGGNEELSSTKKTKALLLENKLILDNNPLPENGKILSDLLNTCFTDKIISEADFLAARGKELLESSLQKRDADLLNLYAFLVSSSPDLLAYADSLGWKEFGQERFAIGYLRYKGPGLKSTDALVEKAVAEFPNSSKIFLLNVSLKAKEKTLKKADVVELIRRDFKTMDSGSGLNPLFGIGHNSYALKSYFMSLPALE